MRDYSKVNIQEILLSEMEYFKTQGRKINSITLGHIDYDYFRTVYPFQFSYDSNCFESRFYGILIRRAKKAKNLIRVNCKKDVLVNWVYPLANPNWVSKNKIDWSGIPLDLFFYGQNKFSSTLL